MLLLSLSCSREEKEGQCADFKLRLDEITQKLQNRDEQIAKLKQEAADHHGGASKLDAMAEELHVQKDLQAKTNDRLEKMIAAMEEKEEEVARLTAQLEERSAEFQQLEQEWEIKLTQSECEPDGMREKRKEAMLKSDDADLESSQELKLASRLEILTNKISEGERQLADLEREFKEKWEQSAAESQAKSRNKKDKKGKVPNLLSRFRR